jgi:hypothetical protein
LPKTSASAASIALSLNAPVAAADRFKFEAVIKAFTAAVSAIVDEKDEAAGELYFHAFENVCCVSSLSISAYV